MQNYLSATTIAPLAPVITGNPVTLGFNVSPALPAGLSLDNTTGVISGKPMVASPATIYTITGTNSYGSATAIVNIAVMQLVKPTIQDTYLIFSSITTNSTHISWTKGNGAARVVFAKIVLPGGGGGQDPVNNTTYTASTVFGQAGSEVGTSGWFCVYNGTGSSSDITGLAANTTYRVAVQDYNGPAGNELYLPSGSARGNVTTLPLALNTIFQPLGMAQSTTQISTPSEEQVVANNILSPNGDGVNDIWVVKNIAFYPNNTVTVYDRTGRVVFTAKNYANNWSGTDRGGFVTEGAYYYLIDLGNGKKMKGFITVVR